MTDLNMLTKCNLCIRNCNINRYEKTGACNSGKNIKIARAALHFYEEPCISGKNLSLIHIFLASLASLLASILFS